MHSPIRAHFVVDAPIDRVEAVLSRRPDLRQLVRNSWVVFIVRDPETNQFFKESNGSYLNIKLNDHEATKTYIPFQFHMNHAMKVAHREAVIYWLAFSGMILSCVVPIYLFGSESMISFGPIIGACGTMLSLPVLSFARRYLHGEFMFGRFASLCVGLVLGFNLVATAPSLYYALAGWSLFGFSSTFLIGAYNDRPTVRNNATFAFAAYRISDFALLIAATFSATGNIMVGIFESDSLVAACLILAALFKSSQFPLIGLFARSMEGPTPASALGYAGLSAHVGTILLSSTMPLWFGFEWARILVGSVGLFTASYSSLLSKIRADRKGAIANATSATIGLILVILSFGYRDLALFLSLGHATFRIIQVLRSPNIISDAKKIKDGLGYLPQPRKVPIILYKFTWMLHRFVSDFQLIQLLQMTTRHIHIDKPWKLTKLQQWLSTAVIVTFAGAPFTPFSHYLEEFLIELLPHHPSIAVGIMLGHFIVSIVLIRVLFLKVLDKSRFHLKFRSQK
jgi:NADH:ubiquinone oxidoreductase subunit 5 (subunit L)/multisubunit Na+/H+ antiporter MnhA subunit